MDIRIRCAALADVPVLRPLIDASVRGLHSRDYTPAQIEGALAQIYGVDTQLIADGTYFVAETGAENNSRVFVSDIAAAVSPEQQSSAGLIVGCGGWSKRKTLYGGDQWTDREPAILDPEHDAAKIRAFFVHPAWTRRGIGSMILEASERAAVAAGFTHFEMGATLTGVPLYRAHGYIPMENLQVLLGNGEVLPIVRMEKRVPFDSRLR